MFTLLSESKAGRRGRIGTFHGTVETPMFLPVATGGAMKGISHHDLHGFGAQILLCNTYHLHLQPGEDIVKEAGGLHAFISWNKPILTDSGGFQVFSLRRTNAITSEGIRFRSHLNGDTLFLDPEAAMRIQHALGSDILMCLDHCPPSTASDTDIEEAVRHTLAWAEKCKRIHGEFCGMRHTTPLLFCVVQGGLNRRLRQRCAEELIAMDFDGYAVGGLAVGESEEEMLDVLQDVCPLLPKDKPRYLMGVGMVGQMKRCVAKGIDMFDSVVPMRLARHGTVLRSDGSSVRITNASERHRHEPIDADSPSSLSRIHSRSYLHHLMKANERFGETIACMQNIAVTLKAMQELQENV